MNKTIKTYLWIAGLAVVVLLMVKGCQSCSCNGDKAEEKKGEQAVAQKVVDERDFLERGGLKYEVNSEKPFTGIAISYSETGDKQKEQEYRNGKEEGKCILFFSNGQKLLETWKQDGKENGKGTMWYASGQKDTEAWHRDDKFHGKFTKWYENGQKKEVGEYQDGKGHGKATGWYENGQKMYESNFRDDKLHGKLIMWYENGQKKVEGECRDGESIKKDCWDKNGNAIPCSELNVEPNSNEAQAAQSEQETSGPQSLEDFKEALMYKNQNEVINLIGRPSSTQGRCWWYEKAMGYDDITGKYRGLFLIFNENNTRINEVRWF